MIITRVNWYLSRFPLCTNVFIGESMFYLFFYLSNILTTFVHELSEILSFFFILICLSILGFFGEIINLCFLDIFVFSIKHWKCREYYTSYVFCCSWAGINFMFFLCLVNKGFQFFIQINSHIYKNEFYYWSSYVNFKIEELYYFQRQFADIVLLCLCLYQ